MKKLIEKLKNPFDGLTKEKFQDECFDIANTLFSDYCINCNGKEFYFAEIEFYYWDKDNWNEKWNRITYSRDGYKAGTLFFHISGFDICFESYYDNAKFGGILIRTIINDNNEIYAGPLNCKDIILNSCGIGNMPLLKRMGGKRKWIPNVKPTNRLLGKEDMKNNIDGNLNLCFYDSNIPINNWNLEKKRYDKAKGCVIERKGTYKVDRFKNDN